MAYDNEIDFSSTSRAIEDDLLRNAADITSTELLDTAAGVTVPVIKEVDGIPKVGRVSIETLTEEVVAAARDARQQASSASLQAQAAQTAARNAQDAAEEAQTAIDGLQDCVEEIQERIDTFIDEVTVSTGRQVQALADMVEQRRIRRQETSYQLYEEVKARHPTWTWNDFVRNYGGDGPGADMDVDSAISSTSENPVQNKVIALELAGKQDVIEYLTAQDINAIVNS